MPRNLFTTAPLIRNYAHRSQLPHWQGIMPPLFDNYTTGKELCRADCSTGKELRPPSTVALLARNYAAIVWQLHHRQGIMPCRLFATALQARNYAHHSQLPHWQGIMPSLFDNYTTGKELCRADCLQLHYWQGITPTVHSCPTGKELCRRCLTTAPQARSYAAQIVRSCSTTQNIKLFVWTSMIMKLNSCSIYRVGWSDRW